MQNIQIFPFQRKYLNYLGNFNVEKVKTMQIIVYVSSNRNRFSTKMADTTLARIAYQKIIKLS